MSNSTEAQVHIPVLQQSSARICFRATGTCLMLFAAANLIARNVRLPLPPAIVTETVFLASSLILAAWLSRGNLSSFGFTKGEFHFRPSILLWALAGTGSVVIMVMVVRLTGAAPPHDGPQSHLAVVLQVWIFASLCEEVFMRGLYQSWLSPLRDYKLRVSQNIHLAAPVLLSALFFGGMHAVLWPRIGPLALLIMFSATILGIIAGYYRDKTGSLAPAILIHALFNIGGSLPFWILQRVVKP